MAPQVDIISNWESRNVKGSISNSCWVVDEELCHLPQSCPFSRCTNELTVYKRQCRTSHSQCPPPPSARCWTVWTILELALWTQTCKMYVCMYVFCKQTKEWLLYFLRWSRIKKIILGGVWSSHNYMNIVILFSRLWCLESLCRWNIIFAHM